MPRHGRDNQKFGILVFGLALEMLELAECLAMENFLRHRDFLAIDKGAGKAKGRLSVILRRFGEQIETGRKGLGLGRLRYGIIGAFQYMRIKLRRHAHRRKRQFLNFFELVKHDLLSSCHRIPLQRKTVICCRQNYAAPQHNIGKLSVIVSIFCDFTEN